MILFSKFKMPVSWYARTHCSASQHYEQTKGFANYRPTGEGTAEMK